MNSPTPNPKREARSKNAPTIEPGALFDQMIHGRRVLAIDVRDRSEIEASQLRFPHAVNIPVHQLFVRRFELPPDTTTPIVAISGDGTRARSAAFTLTLLGYTNVHALAGGIQRWVRQRFPTA